MSHSSDEEDYMSDAFLQSSDTRPGLAPKSLQRKYEQEKKQKEAKKKNVFVPREKLESQQREAGLGATMSTQSKGFALLQKMGYKPGMGIGKTGAGRLEPVSIHLKTGRAGLGQESEMKRKADEMQEMRAMLASKRKKNAEKNKEDFVDRMRERFSERNVEKDLRTAQKACIQLDQEQGISEPGEIFFWPANSLASGKEDDDQTSDENGDSDEDDGVIETPAYLEFSDFERLDILTRYLRNTYNYCIWCGTKYNDKDDMSSNCPGNTAEAHD